MNRLSRLWISRYAGLGLLLAAGLVLVGCGGGYTIKGRVIRGSAADIQLVDQDDPRLADANATGGGAVVQGVLEPDTPSEMRDLGRHITNGQGWFEIPVNAMGAGLLEYEAQLVARREGHQGAINTLALPRGGQRVLITLPVGRDTLVVPERFIDSVRREARPYLEED